MAALTEERSPEPTTPAFEEPTSTREPGPEAVEQAEPSPGLDIQRIRSDPKLQAEWDRQVAADAAARFEADRRNHEAQRIADARKADDERYARIGHQLQEYALGRSDPPSDENQDWFASHETTRRVQEAEAKVFQSWANDYDGTRAKIKELPDFREYVNRSTGDLIEAVYQAGRSSREPEIEAEAKKLAEAMTAERMDQHRGTLPNPEVARTATNGSGINTIGDLMALSSADRYALKRDNPALYNRLTAQATRG